jgi:hypothetical protein
MSTAVQPPTEPKPANRRRTLPLRIVAVFCMALTVLIAGALLWDLVGGAFANAKEISSDSGNGVMLHGLEPPAWEAARNAAWVLLFAGVPMLLLWRLYKLRRWAGLTLAVLTGIPFAYCVRLDRATLAYSTGAGELRALLILVTPLIVGTVVLAWRELKRGF